MTVKCSDKYIASTVSVPKNEKHIYDELTIDENTEFIDFMLETIKSNPQIVQKRPYMRATINFKARRSHLNKYKEIQKILRKYNFSFSNLFRDLYPGFVKNKRKSKLRY